MNNTSKMIKKMEELCDVNIDFDGASEAWKNNKKSIGNGSYKYKCKNINCSEPRIIHKPDDINYNRSIYSDYCNYHYKSMNMKNTIIID